MPFDALEFDKQTQTDLQLLEQVRHRLRRPQLWCQYTIARGRQLCVMGGIARVLGTPMGALLTRGDFDVRMDAYHRLIDAIETYLPPQFDCLSQFNDDKATTHADVMALLDRVIADYRLRLGMD